MERNRSSIPGKVHPFQLKILSLRTCCEQSLCPQYQQLYLFWFITKLSFHLMDHRTETHKYSPSFVELWDILTTTTKYLEPLILSVIEPSYLPNICLYFRGQQTVAPIHISVMVGQPSNIAFHSLDGLQAAQQKRGVFSTLPGRNMESVCHGRWLHPL